MRSEIVIAHLSDLHHPTIKEETWTRLKSYLVERDPDLILVTGDLTNHPWPWRHLQVRRKLLKLVDECQKSRLRDAKEIAGTAGGTDRRRDVILRVVPGNHDCAFWGNVGFYFLKWVSFDLVFRGYQQTFFDFSTDKLKLYFFSFNSNPFVARWAKGSVSRRQLKSFQRKMDELQESQRDSINDAYKVALLHHHPVPIPYDEKLEKYLFLKNAGEFINSMAQNRVNLVLHGHKHKPRISSVSLGTASASRNVAIVASGSTLKDGEESTCNLITIYDNMRVEVKQAVAIPGEDFVEKEITTYLPSWDTYIEERYAAGKNKLGYEIESLSHAATIDDEGDGYSKVSVAGLRVTNPQKFKGVEPFEENVTAGTIDHFKVHADGPIKPLLTIEGGAGDSVIAKLIFNLPKNNQQSHSFGFEYCGLNSWALNTEQWDRKYVNNKEIPRHSEEIYFEFRRPIKAFNLEVYLPDGCELDGEPQLIIHALDGDKLSPEPIRGLQEHLAIALKFSRVRKVILMNLKKPLFRYRYIVRWYLSPPAARKSVGYRAEAEELILRLLERKGQGVFRKSLLTVEEMVREKFEIKADERIDVTLAVPARDQGKGGSLEFIETNLDDARIKGCLLAIGDGTQGRAYKENSIRYYTEDEVNSDDWKSNIYIPVGGYKHKVLYSVPLVHPMNREQIIGILSVGSQRATSVLIPKGSGSPEEIEERILEVAQQIADFGDDYLLSSLIKECGVEITYPCEEEGVDDADSRE